MTTSVMTHRTGTTVTCGVIHSAERMSFAQAPQIPRYLVSMLEFGKYLVSMLEFGKYLVSMLVRRGIRGASGALWQSFWGTANQSSLMLSF